jgi:hypothetical protein
VTLLICTFLPVRKRCLKVESFIALLPEYLIWLSAIRCTLRSVAPSILLTGTFEVSIFAIYHCQLPADDDLVIETFVTDTIGFEDCCEVTGCRRRSSRELREIGFVRRNPTAEKRANFKRLRPTW